MFSPTATRSGRPAEVPVIVLRRERATLASDGPKRGLPVALQQFLRTRDKTGNPPSKEKVACNRRRAFVQSCAPVVESRATSYKARESGVTDLCASNILSKRLRTSTPEQGAA